MKLMKKIGVVALAFGLVAFAASDAAAQAPTLTANVSGSQVTLSWTAIPGATGYQIAVAGSLAATVPLPASVTFVQANAPAGTYSIAVRATAGAVLGPFSNVATVVVGGTPGPGPCTAPTAPTVTATVNGGSVAIAWAPVAGVTGYQVQFSRFPGGTEVAQNTTQTSYGQWVGLIGTYYVRVVALSACGNTPSAEVAFSITTLAGTGPRTPDPAPGTLLPKPNYGQEIVISLSNQFRGDLLNSCHEFGGNNIFMFRVLAALRQRDSRWGLNIKRGNQGLSQDIITFNPTAGPDNGAQQIYLWDMIGGHCGPSPTWNWADVTAATWAGGQAGLCSNAWCARWSIDDYLRAGFPPDQRD